MSKKRRYWHEVVGYNYRLTNLQAAIGVAQMERVDQFIDAKIRIANRYRQGLAGIVGLQLPELLPNCRNTYWLFTLLVKPELGLSREELMQKLLANGIETRPTFVSLHLMPPYTQYAANKSFKNSLTISNEGMSFPSAASLSNDDVDSICLSIRSILEARNFIQ